MTFLRSNLFVYLSLLVAVTACDSPSKETESAETTSQTKKKPTSEEQSLVQVVDGYLLLKDALVASNLEEAQTKATNMLEVIDATNMMNVQQSTKQIVAATDIDTQRAYFDSLSVYLYEYVDEQTGDEHTLYRQYCPMAFDNRGAYWLSNAKEIRNPYFGDEMLSCGRVEEAITY